MAPFTLSEIAVYPLKSVGGVYPNEVNITPKGIAYDRQWMVVAPDGTMHSQRTLPAMATIASQLTTTECILHLSGQTSLKLPLANTEGTIKSVELWGQTLEAIHLSEAYDNALSEFLGTSSQLVYLPARSHRPIDPTYAQGSTIGFSDGFPFLVANSASLEQLNENLAAPIPMNRFRANFIVDGASPFAEDRWKKIKIGPAFFSLVKPCTRCAIITTNQETGERDPEPLAALKTFRTLKSPQINGVIFGENAITNYFGTLKVGMPVEIVEED